MTTKQLMRVIAARSGIQLTETDLDELVSFGNDEVIVKGTKSIDDTDSPYTVQNSDFYLRVDTTSGPVTVNLPPAASDDNRQLIIKDINKNAATNNITVVRSGSDTIDTAASNFAMTNDGEFLRIVSEASSNNWDITQATVSAAAGVTSVNGDSGPAVVLDTDDISEGTTNFYLSGNASRLISGGADELDGDNLDIDWTPSNYTPDATPAEASGVDSLTAHLQGIDTALSAATGIDGSGTADQFSYFTDSNTLTSGTQLQRNATGIGIGIAPQEPLHVSADGVTAAATFQNAQTALFVTDGSGSVAVRAVSASSTAGESPQFSTVRARGTLGSPTTTSDGDWLALFSGGGINTSNAASGAGFMVFKQDGAAAGFVPGSLTFNITNSSGTGTDAFVLDSDEDITLTGSIIMAASETVDGVDVSAHAADADAHHTAPSGTAGQVAVFSGADSVISDAALTYSTANDQLGVGGLAAASLGATLHVNDGNTVASAMATGNILLSQDGGFPVLAISQASTVASERGTIVFARAKGTISTPLAVADNDQIQNIVYQGFDGTSRVQGAAINAEVDGTVSTGNVPMLIRFSTGASGGSTDRFRIRGDGRVEFEGQSAPAVSDSNTGALYYDSTADTLKLSLNGGAYADVTTGGPFVDGSGTADQFAYWSDSDTLTSGTQLQRNATGVGIGQTPQVQFHIGDGTTLDSSLFDGTNARFIIHDETNFPVASLIAVDSSGGNYPIITMEQSRGTAASPAASQSGDTTGHIGFIGRDTAGTRAGNVQLWAFVDAAPTATEVPGRLEIRTSDNSSGNVTAMVVDSNQQVGIGTLTAPQAQLHVNDGTAPHSAYTIGATTDVLVSHDTDQAKLTLATAGTSNYPLLAFMNARGTLDTPTANVSGDIIAETIYRGHDGTDLDQGSARIQVEVDGTVAASTVPMSYTVQTSATDTTGLTDALVISSAQDVTVPNGNLGIGGLAGSATDALLHVNDGVDPNADFLVGATPDVLISDSGDFANLQIIAAGTGLTYPLVSYFRSRGTLDTPTASVDGDVQGEQVYRGHDGTDFEIAARTRVEIDGTVASNTVPMRYLIQTSATGIGGITDALIVDSAQDVTVPNGNFAVSAGTALVDGAADAVQLTVQGHSTQTSDIFVVENSAGTDQFTVDNTGNIDVAGNSVVTGSSANGQSTVSLTADDQVVDTTGNSYIQLSSDSVTAADRTFTLDQGDVAGHMLVLEWTGTNAGELIDDAAVSGGGNHRLSATWTPTQYDTLTLIWNGTDWIELHRSTN